MRHCLPGSRLYNPWGEGRLKAQEKNVLMAGVGGQGVVLASDILAQVAANAGMDVKKSEVHGMAQRGGAVSCHLRFGNKVWSAFIKRGQADVLLAFEEMEGLRWQVFLKPDGVAIVNRLQIIPPASFSKGQSYPAEPLDEFKKNVKHLHVVEANRLALEMGNPKLANSVLLGVLSLFLPFPAEAWEKEIAGRVPKATVEINLKAFLKGRGLAQAG